MKIKHIAAALFLAQSLAAHSPAAEPASALASLRAAAGDARVPDTPGPRASAADQPAPQYTPEHPAPLKEWTVMIFMNGSNNLAEFSLGDLNFIGRTGPSPEVNVAVEFSIMYEKSSVAKRVRLLPPENGKGQAETYNKWKNRDMGDWRNLADFVRWAKASFPARRYMLVIQNHGGGFVDQTYKPKAADKGISYDEVTGNYIKTPELGRVLEQTGPVDLLVMNACEMQMAEVAYELGPAAGVIIASEELDRSGFFQYKERLEYLEANPGEETEKIAAAFIEMRRRLVTPGNQIVFGYGSSTYSYTMPGDIANTLSAVRAGRLAELPAALDKWTGAVMAAGERDGVSIALAYSVRLGALKYEDTDYSVFTDLRDFVGQIDQLSDSQAVKEASRELYARLDGLVIASSGMNTNFGVWDYSQRTHGLGIKIIPHFSKPQVYQNHDVITDTPYEDLKFARDSQWDEFLAWAAGFYYQPR